MSKDKSKKSSYDICPLCKEIKGSGEHAVNTVNLSKEIKYEREEG